MQNKIPHINPSITFNKLSDNEFILCNTLHKHYLKINKDTYDLLSLIDNERSLQEICELHNQQSEKELTVSALHFLFYDKLSKYGLLVGEEEQIKPYQKPSYLKLSFIIFSKRFIAKITPSLHFLFRKKIAFPLLILCAVMIGTELYWLLEGYKSFKVQESVIFFLVVMAISVTFHELGHATAASHFGAEHGGIGGGFYLFTPVYFADVTDVWRLKKWQRVVVNCAGMYFEIIFCTLLSLVGLLLGQISLTLIAIIVCLHTFFNLNPFLRSDGYWILSDITNKPNLLQHSFRKIGDVFKMIKGKKVQWTKIDFLLLVYGLISYSFIVLFVYYVLFKNPHSILNFPQNLYHFLKSLCNKDATISLVSFGELIVPMLFFYLLFSFLKSILRKKKI